MIEKLFRPRPRYSAQSDEQDQGLLGSPRSPSWTKHRDSDVEMGSPTGKGEDEAASEFNGHKVPIGDSAINPSPGRTD